MVSKPKKGENTWSQELVELLHMRGLQSAKFEPIYHIFKLGRGTVSKPDIIIPNGITHVVSGKLGDRQELQAYSTAHQYSIELAPVTNLGEVFGLTYPERPQERFHLHILPNIRRPTEISLTLDSIDEVADKIVESVAGRASQFEPQAEPVYEEAHRLLTAGAEALGESMRGVKDADLEAVLGGHEFFVSLLRPRLKDLEMRRSALRVGAAFLFVSQTLFYVLLSKAAQRAGKEKDFPPIDVSLGKSPLRLQQEYFNRVKAKDYEPIYGFDVSKSLSSAAAEIASEQIVKAILDLAPRLDTPEAPATPGRVFQSMIPFEIRKPLGAHYTNPRAAVLLARLAIGSPNVTVFDPACGSGTLLSAAYRRKMELTPVSEEKVLHRRFLEKEITGIDAMMFSAHLAAVNLALQQPLQDTDSVRIGTMDSTRLEPGDAVAPIEASLPSQFKQTKLDEPQDIEEKGKRYTGPVRLGARRARTFAVDRVGLIIMNPPFTSWDNMAEDYRQQLNDRISLKGSGYGKILFWKISQQAHFVLLADSFLEPDGTLAAVLPITTFTGRAFGNLVKFLVARYRIQYIVVGLKQSSFSEDTSLTECLFVASKRTEEKTDDDSHFTMVGLLKRPDDLTIDDVERVARAAEDHRECDIASIRRYRCDELLPEKETLPGLLLRLLPSYRSARTKLDETLSVSRIPLVNFGDLRDETKVRKKDEIYLSRWVLGSEHFSYYGAKALVACGDEARAIKESDRLIFAGTTSNHVILRDRVGGAEYRFAKEDLTPALRRFSKLPSFDISREVDYVIANPVPELEKVMVAIYGKTSAREYLTRIRQLTKNHSARWPSRVLEGSSRLAIARRLNLGAPGTTVIATWSHKPVFLATDGYMVRGTTDEVYERLLCLWFNSSLFLLLALGRLTVTEGSWVKFEEYAIERIRVPSPEALEPDLATEINEVFKESSRRHLPSILEQLSSNDEARLLIDDAILRWLGVNDKQERDDLAKAIRKGILDSLNTLKGTMSPSGPESDEKDEE